MLVSLDCSSCNTGTCRLVEGKHKIRDRQQQAANPTNFPLALIHVAAQSKITNEEDEEHNVQQWVLCRIASSMQKENFISRYPRVFKPELTYSCSVCLITIKDCRKDIPWSRVKDRILLQCGRRSDVVHRTVHLTEARTCPSRETSIASDNPQWTNESEGATVTFFGPPSHNQQQLAAAVSVSLTCRSASVTDSKNEGASTVVLETQPLLQTCIKRQLVGCPIVLDIPGGVTTEIRIPTTIAGRRWTLTVRSASAVASAGDAPIIAMILPSTRVTLIPEETNHLADGQQHANLTTSQIDESISAVQRQKSIYLSPAVRLLVDTIRCIRLLQVSGSSSQITTASICLIV